ncbi:MauE/DoxX family redox-associated membrane protein [Edaphobacter modestus]|uniref:Thiosulfate dehydrogenase [quinone] large subunit n=1 Tax=Edaphobacter modestus TaxID=388466 RepID=A0A4Q7YQ96_9BACT|nr:MauE/DoxX family redox-associated membrane protein [Edaphobacter modestus]RZU39031.1 thiosulfate dehydrogenase [quinone] large subunit [Edaphobacter modestus]
MQFNTSKSDEKIAYALLRAVAGTNLLMHGVSRLLAGSQGFATHLTEQFAHSPLPESMVRAFGAMLPPIEGLIGLLLLIGLKTRWTLIAASLLMLVLTFGSALVQDWTAAGAQLVYALVFSVLLFLRQYNAWSLDGCMNKA